MRKMKRFLALALAATMTISSMSVTSFAAISERPVDGVTENQPFAPGTGGSTNFRIPCLVTLNDGTIVAGCDARWNHASDACGLDTIISRSTDGGETWNYTFANYLGDNGNQFDYNSTAFIDPAMATDGETIWLVADLYPAGVAINTVPANKQARPGHTGYTEDGELALALATDSVNGYSTSDARANASLYTYHLEKIEGAADDAESYYKIVDADGNVDDRYTVDAYFNIKGEGVDTNLFIIDSPYFPFPTDFLYMTKSTDGGATWSIPSLMDVKKADEQTLLVGPGRGIVTSTGRLIFTCYDFTYGDDRSSCLYSDDGGETWTRGEDVSGWSSEAVVTEADGKLYMFTRHGNCYYISEDWGETWGDPISVAPAYNSNCQLSAITYSEKVDGKTAIILSAPANTGSRSQGRLFLGLVQEDGTLEWVNEYKVTEGAYAYSCLDELSNGNIALLYESAGSAITYKELDINEVLGLVKNLELSLGSTYVEEKSATEAPEITQKPDESIATVTSELVIEEATTVLHNHVANSASDVTGSFSATADDTMNLADAEFTFTASGDNWIIYNEAKGLYLRNENVASEFFSSDSAEMMVTPSTEVENAFTICKSTGTRYVIFYNNNMDFNSNSGFTANWNGGSYSLMLLEKQDTASEDDILPGYKQVSEITDGKNYLISYIWDENNIMVLYPTNGTGNQTKLVGETKTVSKSVVTITAVGIGETSAVIGDVTYNINVPDPKDDPAYSDDDYDLTKLTYTTGSEQPASGNEGPVSYAFDGDTNTFWHSEWNPTWPATDFEEYLWVEFALEEATVVDAIRYLPRNGNGDITSYRVEAKTAESGDEWITLTEGDWARGDSNWKLAQFEATEVTSLRLVATGTYADSGNNRFASAKELRVRTASLAPEVECAEHTTELVGKADATCTEDGHTGNLVCTNCGTVVEAGEVIPATGHAWGETETTDATCTEAGKEVKTCETCGEVEETTIPALGHTWSEWTVVKEPTEEEDGLQTRTCSTCGEVEEEVIPKNTPWENPFKDVSETEWYYKAVEWGSKNNVVAGITTDMFYPAASCTRAQIVSFLWRASGRPEPATTECKFTDVAADQWYYKAVLWATEKGYVAGYDDTLFAPDATCTRAEMATFLWRMEGKQDPASAENPFIDIPEKEWYAKAAQWTYENGIVSGYDTEEGKAFAPANTIARAETVTMLYRFFN